MSYAEPVSWNGAGGWGPRYLVPILAFITIVSGTLLRQSRDIQRNNGLFLRVSIIVLCFAGFYVNLTGKLIWYIYGYGYAIDVKGMMKYIQMGNFTDASVSSWFPYYSPNHSSYRSLSI